jgi:hypothetical protein
MKLPVALLLSLALTGCATAAARRSSGKPLHQFPSRAELGQLVAASSGREAPLPEVASVDVWTLAPESAAIADSAATGQAPAQTPWNALLEELATKAKAVPTPAMRCLAAELARVHLEAGEVPDPGLYRFLAGRCGALVSHTSTMVWKHALAEGILLEDAFAQWQAQISPDLQKQLVASEHVGFGVARGQGQVVMVLSKAVPEVALESFSRMVDAESRLVLQGKLRDPATGLTALVNQGAHAVAHCEVDPAIALPAFRVRCPIATADEHAWIQLAATPPGLVLSRQVLNVLALRAPTAALTFSRQAGEPAPVSDESSFRKAVVALVNEMRARGGMRPLTLSIEQSVTVSELLAPFFGAHVAANEAAHDAINRITLGLMAGWEVKVGTIRDASLAVVFNAMAPDARRWVTDALDEPLGRNVLLDPEAEVLALGALLRREPDGVAAIAVSYRFFEQEQKPGERATQLLERLARVRKARGLGETTQVQQMVGMAEVLADIESGRATPFKALEYAMHDVASATGRAVQGLVWETHDLDAIEFPPELLRRGNLMLGAGVTFYRPEGAAWGQYTVVFVVIDLTQGGEA